MQTLRKTPPISRKPGRGAPSILVAEDNHVNQKLMALLFKKLNLEIDIVSNGEEAVAAALSKSYDLIMMDIQMPLMDGLEACTQIKNVLGNKAPAIVALTANALSGARESYLESGMDHYLSKPLKIDDIKQTILEFTFYSDLS